MAIEPPTIRSVRSVEVIEVIRVILVRGAGEFVTDPVREVVQYWSKDGKFLAAQDPCCEPDR